MDSTPTLHDFVLNLITNQDARLAFELDPEGALQDARLGDLTPADVQDVIPLVVDLTPVQGLLPAPVDTLSLGALPVDPTAAAGQLQHLIQQLPIPSTSHSASADVNVAVLGAITVDPASGALDVFHTLDSVGDVLPETGPALPAIPGGLGDGLPVGNGLPLDSVTSLTGDVTGGLTSGNLSGNLTGDLIGSLPGDLVGSLTGTVGGGSLGGLTGSAGDLTGTVGGTLDGVTGTLDGVTGTLGGVTGSLGGVTGSLGLGASADASASGGAGGGLLGLTDGLL